MRGSKQEPGGPAASARKLSRSHPHREDFHSLQGRVSAQSPRLRLGPGCCSSSRPCLTVGCLQGQRTPKAYWGHTAWGPEVLALEERDRPVSLWGERLLPGEAGWTASEARSQVGAFPLLPRNFEKGPDAA